MGVGGLGMEETNTGRPRFGTSDNGFWFRSGGCSVPELLELYRNFVEERGCVSTLHLQGVSERRNGTEVFLLQGSEISV